MISSYMAALESVTGGGHLLDLNSGETRGGTRFSELEESRSSVFRFAFAIPPTPFIHLKSSDLHKSHGSPCWRLGVQTTGHPTHHRPWQKLVVWWHNKV